MRNRSHIFNKYEFILPSIFLLELLIISIFGSPPLTEIITFANPFRDYFIAVIIGPIIEEIIFRTLFVCTTFLLWFSFVHIQKKRESKVSSSNIPNLKWFFRKICVQGNQIQNKGYIIIFLMVTNIIFAFIHSFESGDIFNVIFQIFPHFLGGIAYGWCFIRGGMPAALLYRSINNLISLTGEYNPSVSFIYNLILLLTIIIFSIIMEKRARTVQPSSSHTNEIFTPTTAWITFVIWFTFILPITAVIGDIFLGFIVKNT